MNAVVNPDVHRCIKHRQPVKQRVKRHPSRARLHSFHILYLQIAELKYRHGNKLNNEPVNKLLAHSPFSPPLVAGNKRNYGKTTGTKDL